jgi:hypothetical protein
VGTDPDGYWGGVFDGRYVYFAPWSNGTSYHGEVLRYDTTAPFAGAASWATYDAGAHGVGTDPDGYAGAAFDGRYVYFAPSFSGSAYHGEVLRYDAIAPFDSALSWATYDPGAHGVGTDPDGYSGVAFDGRYLYFSPYHNGSDYHGEVLRYDTAAEFAAATSWSAYDPGAHGVGSDPDGFSGVVFDGRYLYFSPYYNGTDYSGEVLRYDASGEFTTAAAWVTFDPGAHGVGSFAVGFEGAVFDGRFVYFVPLRDAVNHYHGEVLRYDSSRDFATAQSWDAFEPHQAQVGTVGAGFCGGAFDGRYVYFAPYVANSGYHGEVLRYDTRIGWDCDNNGVIDDCEIASGAAHDLNHNGILDRCEGVGDVNCDGSVSFDDIQPFVLALVGQANYEAQYPGCRWLNGDIDRDGRVTFDDIGPFVACLVSGGCP